MRIAIVLGAGAFPGYAWHIGVLRALQDVADVDARDAALLVGTSIGAITAGVLRGGFAPEDLTAELAGAPMSAHGADLLANRCDPPGELPPDYGPLRVPAPWPNGFGALRGLARTAGSRRHPWRSAVPAAAASLFPTGRVTMEPIRHSMDVLHGHAWPAKELWTVALRPDTGERVVFGRGDAPATSPGTATTASASIPGFFAPVVVDGVRHVDAGVHSTTNADLLAGRRDLDLVIVSAPLAVRGTAWTIDAPMRALAAAQVRHEVARLREAGQQVVVLAPDATTARLMGGNPLADDREAAMRVHDAARDLVAAQLASVLPASVLPASRRTTATVTAPAARPTAADGATGPQRVLAGAATADEAVATPAAA